MATPLQRAPSAELESKSADVSLMPAEWNLAWEEFGRRCPRLKRGALLVNALVFNGAGLSILAIFSFVYGWLPWWAFALMLLSTLALSQMFVIRFAGLAHEREKDSLREQLRSAEIRGQNYGLRLYIDAKRTRVAYCGESRDSEGNVTGRLIGANVRLRCFKIGDSTLAVHDVAATLIEFSDGREEVLAQGTLANAYLDNEAQQRIDVDRGWIVDEPLTAFRWYRFIFELSAAMISRLTNYNHVFRITMDAIGQEPQYVEFWVDKWEDALPATAAGSTITLR